MYTDVLVMSNFFFILYISVSVISFLCHKMMYKNYKYNKYSYENYNIKFLGIEI